MLNPLTNGMTSPERDAFTLGYEDGCEQPDELESGVTYDDPALNEAYDFGANVGQAHTRYRRSVMVD